MLAVELTDGPLQFWATLGVGGAIAGFMFLYYRRDVLQLLDNWKQFVTDSSSRWNNALEIERHRTDLLIGVVKDNTASNAHLVALMEAQERRSLEMMAPQAPYRRESDKIGLKASLEGPSR